MGSRGSEYDDGIKANKAKKDKPQKSNAELRIEAEGTKFKDLPKIGLGTNQRGIYAHQGKLAVDLMNRVKQQALVTTNVPSITDRQQGDFIDKLIAGKIQNSDGGFYVTENDYETNQFVMGTLGYNTVQDIGNDIASALTNAVADDSANASDLTKNLHIFNMKYSDRYVPSVGGKKQEGQMYEYMLELKDVNGQSHPAYVKLMNVHDKNGATYSIVMSIHPPTYNLSEIWNKSEQSQPRYNK